MADGGGTKTQKQTQTVEPYKPSQPGLNQSIQDVMDLYNAGGLHVDYPTTTVAPVAPEQEAAWQAIGDRAMAGNPLLGQSQDYLGKAIRGDFLSADTAPGFQAVLDRTKNLVNSNISAKSAYGSGLHQGAIADSLGQLEYANYTRERGYQDAAALAAPGVAQQDYYDPMQLLNVGNQRRDVLQQFVTDEAARQQWQQQEEANRIALYQSLLGGQFGGTTTARVPVQQQNPLLLALGGATGLGGSLLGNPGLFG